MSNPAVSFRVTRDDRKRLASLSQRTGKSLGQLLREALIASEREETSTFNRGWAAGYAAGAKAGRSEGHKAAFGSVYLLCRWCGKTFLVNFYQNRKVAKVLNDSFVQWGHPECIARARRQR